MSIQKQMIEQLYGLADKAQAPDQIKALQQQITRSIQDGAIPAYAAIPLVQDLTGRLQQAQTMQQAAAPQPQQPPIAQQVLAQAQGLDNMPSNLPTGEQAYAAGGIVAFAEGDLVDDETETDDDRQESTLMSLMAAARNKIQAGLSRVNAQYLPQSYAKATTEAPAAPVEGGLSGILSSVADKYKVPSALLSRLANAESSGSANAANPRSSAKGLFQFTDSTWKGMGGKQGEQFNPEVNADLGAKYIRQNAEHLKKELGRDPTYHEVYAAHMFGPGVSKMLNKANPKDPIERGLSLFESPAMVKKIMRANPNLRNKSVSQVLDSLENKTGEGIVPLAKGGPIAFDGGGYTSLYEENPYDPNEPSIGDTFGRMMGSPLERLKNSIMGVGPKTSAEIAKELDAKTPKAATEEDRKRQEQMEYQDLIEGPQARQLVRPSAETKTDSDKKAADETKKSDAQAAVKPEAQVTPEAVDPYLEKYMGMLQKREEETAKQKDIDTYMAVMQAGLGMMGGSSPYAMQNIGQGGTQGLASYAAAQKQRAAEEAATLSGYGKLYTAKQAADLRRDLATESKDVKLARMAQDKELTTTRLAQEKELKLNNLVAGREKQLETVAYNNVIKAIGTAFTDMTPEQKTMAVNAELQRLKSGDTLLKKYYNDLGLPPVEAAVGPAGAVPDYSKLYGLTPKK